METSHTYRIKEGSNMSNLVVVEPLTNDRDVFFVTSTLIDAAVLLYRSRVIDSRSLGLMLDRLNAKYIIK